MKTDLDARRDPLLVAGLPAPLLQHAARTCYLVGSAAIAMRRAGRVRLHHETYGAANGLCADQAFREQPVVIERPEGHAGDFGYSGYLLDASTVLTCWHGWEHFAARAQLAILGYALRATGTDPLELPAAQVHAVVPQPASSTPARPVDAAPRGDWVLLRLEHPVTHLGALAPARVAAPRAGRAVYTLGHPGGLPLKLTDQGTVLEVADGLFRTDLQTFTGNSGSPVFDASSHELVGIVVAGPQGEPDFLPQPDRGCYAARPARRHGRGQLSVAATSFAPATTAAGGAPR